MLPYNEARNRLDRVGEKKKMQFFVVLGVIFFGFKSMLTIFLVHEAKFI